MSFNSSKKVADFLHNVPNGIAKWSDDIEGLVETSLNLGVLKTEENCVSASFALRSSVNAEKMALAIGCQFKEISIHNAVKQHFMDIEHDPNNLNVVYENSQARERTQILMDVANSLNGIVIGTGDLSEIALGWSTFNGDQMSMYSVNCSVPKTLMRHMVKYCADNSQEELKNVLYDVLATPVSPELLPGPQPTEGVLGSYEVHDFFLYYTVKYGASPEKIYRMAKHSFAQVYDASTVLKWLRVFTRRFFTQQFKRSCSPDGVRIGSVSLSREDFKMVSDFSYKTFLEELDLNK
jgi:NAD+ synthase (glutamine-hydrolysing)